MDAFKVADFDPRDLPPESLKNSKRKSSLATEFMDLNYGIIEPLRHKSKTEDSLVQLNEI